MHDLLLKYAHRGQFEFSPSDKLRQVCNAPTDRSGIYLVWDITDSCNKELLYIGRSGKKVNDKIVHRKGGLKDRLINGHQFRKESRKKIWPVIMRQCGITKLLVNWFDTEDDDPVVVEHQLLSYMVEAFGCLPKWNKQAY